MTAAHTAWQTPQTIHPGDPYGAWGAATGWSGQPRPGPGPLWVPVLAPDDADLAGFLARTPADAVGAGAWAPPGVRWRVLWLREDAAAAAHQALPRAEFSQPRGPLQPAAPHGAPASPRVGAAGLPVVMAAIDSGGAFLNRVFRHAHAPAQTRFVAVWDQGRDVRGKAHTEAALAWTVPPAGYGRELRGAALQAWCERADAAADGERAAYAALGLGGLLLAEARSEPDHATHVMDTLAGLPETAPRAACAKPDTLDAAAQAPLILVSVPHAPAGQTTGTPTASHLIEALHYILARASELDANCPVVVNVSLGALGGPHDGSSALEQAIDDLMAQHPRLLVVMAAGNTADGPSFDAAGTVQPGAVAGLAWRLQPHDPTDSFLEFWWRGAGAARLQLRVEGPWPSTWVGVGQGTSLQGAGRLLGQLSLQSQAIGLGHWQGRGQLSLAAVSGTRGGVTPGVWRLALRHGSGTPIDVEVRVQGDGNSWALRGGAQSYLDSASGGLVLGAAGSLNGLGCGRWPLLVGAAQADNNRRSPYSSHAPAQSQRQPDALAWADLGSLAPGLVAAGVLSGTWVRMSGTSVAAPIAARLWAQQAVTLGLPKAGRNWRESLLPHSQGPADPTSQAKPPLRPARRR